MAGRGVGGIALGCLLAAGAVGSGAQGIYACVDAKGRRLTSDRPIAECTDREQRVLNRDATVRNTLPPALSPLEQAARDERERKAAEEKLRQAEERRAERALVARYPNQAAHDEERARALNTVDDAIEAGRRRIADLQQQRKQLVTETEFYNKDPAKIPAKLARQLAENDQLQAAQQRFLANQEEEKRRVNARFDEELARLKALWAPVRLVPAAAR